MNKNGEDKVYTFNDHNLQDNFQTLVGCLEDLEQNQTEDRLHEGISVTPVLERPRIDGTIDIAEWLAISEVGTFDGTGENESYF